MFIDVLYHFKFFIIATKYIVLFCFIFPYQFFFREELKFILSSDMVNIFNNNTNL